MKRILGFILMILLLSSRTSLAEEGGDFVWEEVNYRGTFYHETNDLYYGFIYGEVVDIDMKNDILTVESPDKEKVQITFKDEELVVPFGNTEVYVWYQFKGIKDYELCDNLEIIVENTQGSNELFSIASTDLWSSIREDTPWGMPLSEKLLAKTTEVQGEISYYKAFKMIGVSELISVNCVFVTLADEDGKFYDFTYEEFVSDYLDKPDVNYLDRTEFDFVTIYDDKEMRAIILNDYNIAYGFYEVR